ncbi:MAG: PAS domain S-box protein [Candidatus Omnitrophica bacterium]|nr:PAS domain S-box protein [Candidatus Omnitrophota bacterium]
MFAFSLYHFNPSALAPLLVGLLIGVLGFLVVIREKHSVVSLAFSFLTSSAMLWLLSYVGLYCASDPQTAFLWGKTQNLGVVFIPSFLYCFSLVLVKKFRSLGLFAALSLTVSVFFFLIVLFTDQFVTGVYQYPWGYYARYGRFALFFLAFFFVTLVTALGILRAEYRAASTPRQKKRLQILLVAFSIGYLASVDYLPALGIRVYALGYLPVLGFIVLAAYAIWRYHLIDITPEFAAKKIVDTMADVLVVLDAEGMIQVANPAAEKLFGLPAARLIGRPVSLMHENFLTKAQEEALAERGVVPDYSIVLGKAPNEKILSVSAAAMRDDTGTVTAFVCIGRDITEKKRAEDLLIQKTAELAKTDAERNQLKLFALAASHDLRSPLQKIISYTELLKLKARSALDAESKEILDHLLASATRMTELINSLLRLSMVSVKQGDMEPVDLQSSLKDVLTDLEPRMKSAGASVEVGRLPVIRADRSQMYELFQNLIANAIKFHKKGEPPVVKVAGRLLPNGCVEITLQDNGIGFDSKAAERLFQPFERLDLGGEYEGSGMGLAICQKIVERHRGRIAAKGTPGAGATFIVTLPLGA